MRSFFDWYAKECDNNQSWLILGKGPSFDKFTQYDLSTFSLMSLNHVVSKMPVKVAHIIDLDVVETCADDIDKNAEYLVLPWVPHENNKPCNSDLGRLVKSNGFLAKLSQQRRLLYYHHLASKKTGDDPLVRVSFFSSEAAINLLALCGTKQIRTLGIDGGNTYNQAFSHLNDVTLLSNGRKSFNKQFSEIAKIIMSTNVDLAPLDIQSPIKVYVATTEAQMLAVKVLEYSIKKHASMSVEVIPLHLNNIEVPLPKEEKNWPRTPFSFQRFLIPELQHHQGRAIYLDSDMQVFKDIKQLWMTDFGGAQVLYVQNADSTNRKPQFSVMLLDCASLNWYIKKIVQQLDNDTLTYTSLMYEMAVANKAEAKIAPVWNSLERYQSGETCLLHYTDMNTQPWVSSKNPLGYLWCRDLFEALESGFISYDYLEEHIQLGYVRPSLMYQVKHKLDDSLLLPSEAKRLDNDFVAPYQGLNHVKTNFQHIAKAHIRNLLGLDKNKFLIKVRNYLSRD